MSHLATIKIVLVEPSHPGNVGACARAMKNMGLGRLTIAGDCSAIQDKQAAILASGAEDVLDRLETYDNLSQAVADCELVFATSTRERRVTWPMVTPRQCAHKIANNDGLNQTAIVFGRERTGLTNEELQCGNYHLWIPANPEYPSLNLASAVQVVAYELFQSLGEKEPPKKRQPHIRWPTRQEIAYMHNHLERVLSRINFLNRNNPGLLMQRLIALFNRAELDLNELNIIRGVLTAVEKELDRQRS